MKETDNGGALGSIFGLGARQKLQILSMIEKDVEKSENRVLAAIAEFRSEVKAEISAVNRKVDGLATEVANVKTELVGIKANVEIGMKDVELRVGRRLNIQTSVVAALVIAGIGLMASVIFGFDAYVSDLLRQP
ncbi:MAG: hypothetical protein OXD44_03530 [Gammaproteobacteria bacterium]|nr:hypothetical protein [Gammaproteobacteria bacterium]